LKKEEAEAAAAAEEAVGKIFSMDKNIFSDLRPCLEANQDPG
jgi:hypothetical protein